MFVLFMNVTFTSGDRLQQQIFTLLKIIFQIWDG